MIYIEENFEKYRENTHSKESKKTQPFGFVFIHYYFNFVIRYSA